jgi:uncharacterized protein (TIGR00730 family)
MKAVAVFGSSMPKLGEPDYEVAHAVGKALGEAGYAVMTGGYMGVMEAASRGACEVGAHVIGVTCEQIEKIRSGGANQWVKEEIRYRTLDERLRHLIQSADAYVVMPGGVGTINELVLAWEMMAVREIAHRPLICYGKFWEKLLSEFIASHYVPPERKGLVRFADTPQDLIQILQNGYTP